MMAAASPATDSDRRLAQLQSKMAECEGRLPNIDERYFEAWQNGNAADLMQLVREKQGLCMLLSSVRVQIVNILRERIKTLGDRPSNEKHALQDEIATLELNQVNLEISLIEQQLGTIDPQSLLAQQLRRKEEQLRAENEQLRARARGTLSGRGLVHKLC
jgi:hypothetical protein